MTPAYPPASGIAAARYPHVSAVESLVCDQAEAESIRAARRAAAAFCASAGADAAAVQLAEAAASELMTNGLTHHCRRAGELLRLGLRAAPAPDGLRLSLSVTDAGRGRIKALALDGDWVSEHGRGLALLRAMGVTLSDALLAQGYQVTALFTADRAARPGAGGREGAGLSRVTARRGTPSMTTSG